MFEIVLPSYRFSGPISNGDFNSRFCVLASTQPADNAFRSRRVPFHNGYFRMYNRWCSFTNIIQPIVRRGQHNYAIINVCIVIHSKPQYNSSFNAGRKFGLFYLILLLFLHLSIIYNIMLLLLPRLFPVLYSK